MIAAEKGHTKIVQLLLEKGADVNAKNKYGETALMYAAENGHTETVQLLLEKGARYDPFYKTKYGFTYLMVFAIGGLTNYCQELLNKGADVNAKTNDGQTAYDLTENDEIKKILKQYGGKSGKWWKFW
jgi:ankyrin repeat protein